MKVRVLVVDDNQHICLAARRILAAFGITRLDFASDGLTAYGMFQRNPPDIVITDDTDMNGCDRLERVRPIRQDRHSPKPTVPILVRPTGRLRRLVGVRNVDLDQRHRAAILANCRLQRHGRYRSHPRRVPAGQQRF